MYDREVRTMCRTEKKISEECTFRSVIITVPFPIWLDSLFANLLLRCLDKQFINTMLLLEGQCGFRKDNRGVSYYRIIPVSSDIKHAVELDRCFLLSRGTWAID